MVVLVLSRGFEFCFLEEALKSHSKEAMEIHGVDISRQKGNYTRAPRCGPQGILGEQ